ncbi:MAG: hypothetical protein QF615_13515 [Planctomycetota bacterium]|jgi:hypothetical protein|nr:hypothetical protein [Planctomycetota bacterium]MDP6370622.1 hypothetical protein [Planctomycetota bacterium]MDP6518885.1 hypothetical protein [Planctomycetota bacterium]
MQVIEQLKEMDAARFLHIYSALENQGFGPLDGEVAKAMRFRPHAIRKLPMDKRAQKARSILEGRSQAELAYELFGGYLMKVCKSLVTDFLDGTGVAHEDGMIENLQDGGPDPAKVAETIAALDKDHDQADVTLYLSLCAEQWPQVDEIQAAWQARLNPTE